MDYKRLLIKFTSRKFLTMVGTIITAVLVYKGADENTVTQVSAIIGSVATAITYIVTEGIVDKENLQ